MASWYRGGVAGADGPRAPGNCIIQRYFLSPGVVVGARRLEPALCDHVSYQLDASMPTVPRCHLISRAGLTEVQQQIEQIQDVHGPVAVDVLRLATGHGGEPKAQQQIDQIKNVDDAVTVDVADH